MTVAIIVISIYAVVGTVLTLFAIAMISSAIHKYVKARVEEHLRMLEELERISKDIDNEIDGVKIKLYEMYLDRCKNTMRRQQKVNNDLRNNLKKIIKN